MELPSSSPVKCRAFITGTIAAVLLPKVASLADAKTADICIYGGTAIGLIAAVTAAKQGRSVVLIEPSRWLGGMAGDDLSHVDWGRENVSVERTRTRTGLSVSTYRRHWTTVTLAGSRLRRYNQDRSRVRTEDSASKPPTPSSSDFRRIAFGFEFTMADNQNMHWSRDCGRFQLEIQPTRTSRTGDVGHSIIVRNWHAIH